MRFVDWADSGKYQATHADRLIRSHHKHLQGVLTALPISRTYIFLGTNKTPLGLLQSISHHSTDSSLSVQHVAVFSGATATPRIPTPAFKHANRRSGVSGITFEQPISNPGLPSDRQRTSVEEKGSQDPSADVSTVSPPSTLLHKQSFPKDVSEGNFDQPLDWSKYQNTPEYVSTHPTCALNLVCYRTGTKGCELHQIQTILESRFEDKEAFQLAIKESSSLIATDAQLFRALRDVYLQQMCGFWRKALFLKTLRGIRLLSVRPSPPLSFPVLAILLNPKLKLNYKLLTMNSSRQQPDRQLSRSTISYYRNCSTRTRTPRRSARSTSGSIGCSVCGSRTVDTRSSSWRVGTARGLRSRGASRWWFRLWWLLCGARRGAGFRMGLRLLGLF